MDTEARPNPLTLPPVVTAVFKFLPAKALCSAARVCSLWKSHAQRCLEQRKQYSWQYFEQNGSVTVLEMMQQYFEEIAFRPSAVLVFMTDDLWTHIGQPSTFGQKRRHVESSRHSPWKDFFNAALPLRCQVFCSVSPGIVGTTSDLSLTTEKDMGRCASILCFGQHPGLQVSLKNCHLKKHSSLKEKDKTDEPYGEEVKLLLLMSCMAGVTYAIEDIQQEMPRALIVGGIIQTSCVHGVPSDRGSSSSNSSLPYCVVFRGSGLRVACVKLDSDVAHEELAEQVIRRLKAKTRDFDLARSLGFMYACVARGYHLYSRHNIETSLFRRHFPTTPLLGLFGNGEIGCEFPLPEGGDGRGVDMQHAYTTFIAVVSLP